MSVVELPIALDRDKLAAFCRARGIRRRSLFGSLHRRIVPKIEALEVNLSGDVKKLTTFSPEYRLCVGNYRVLFEAEEDRDIVDRMLHRKDAYQ